MQETKIGVIRYDKKKKLIYTKYLLLD